MKNTRFILSGLFLASASASVGAAACGDGGGSTPEDPDSAPPPDALPNGGELVRLNDNITEDTTFLAVNEYVIPRLKQLFVEPGATLTIELPATSGPRRSEPMVIPAESRGPLKILVVDDEPHILHYLRATLESWGHEVTTAGDGAAALEALRAATCDVIVTDLRMPRVSGREFFETLATEHPDLVRRVVFSTGDTVRGDTLAFLERQGRPVLHKPFSLGDLRAALAAAAP